MGSLPGPGQAHSDGTMPSVRTKLFPLALIPPHTRMACKCQHRFKPASPSNVCNLLNERPIFSGFFLMALALAHGFHVGWPLLHRAFGAS